MGVITFTGYELESLRERDESCRRLIDATDLLVDGPYKRREAETERSLVGSVNQRFLHLTDRYAGFDPIGHANRVDIRISAAGEAEVAGFLGEPDVRQLLRLLDARRGTRREARLL